MKYYQAIENEFLSQQGINMQAVFNLADLPQEILVTLKLNEAEPDCFKQLIVFAHGGKALWQALKLSAADSVNPVDEFSVSTVKRYFGEYQKTRNYRLIYPGTCNVNLQKLGALVGWHHPTPFMVGINKHWGSWFAYRALILADTDFTPSEKLQTKSPCLACRDKPCITNCAGEAIPDGRFQFDACISYRKQPTSKCKDKCISRISCPVGEVHRYSKEQINYHYSVSMKAIEEFY